MDENLSDESAHYDLTKDAPESRHVVQISSTQTVPDNDDSLLPNYRRRPRAFLVTQDPVERKSVSNLVDAIVL